MVKKAKPKHTVLRPSELNTLFEEENRVTPKRKSFLNVGCLFTVITVLLFSGALTLMFYSARTGHSQEQTNKAVETLEMKNLEILKPYNGRSKRAVVNQSAESIPFWLSLSCEPYEQLYKDLAYPKSSHRDQRTRFAIKATISEPCMHALRVELGDFPTCRIYCSEKFDEICGISFSHALYFGFSCGKIE